MLKAVSKKPFRQTWTTGDEIKYLNNIGTHTPPKGGRPRRVSTKEKILLLEGALEGYSKRSRWGDIDRQTVVAHAEKLLASYMAKK